MPLTGVTATTKDNVEIGAGRLVVGYGTGSARSLGGTRGGATFTITTTFYDVEVDGLLGPTKDLKRIVGVEVSLECTLVEFSEANVRTLLQGTTKTADTPSAGWDEIKRSSDIASADYLENVALLTTHGFKTKAMVYMVKNALQTNPFAVVSENHGSSSMSCNFMGHFDLANPQDEPWRIYVPTV